MKNINKHWLGAAAVVLAAVLWSLDGRLRVELYSLPPLTIIFAEHAIGTLIAIPLLVALRKKLKKLTQKQIIAIVVVSLLSGVLGTLMFTSALQQINFVPFSVVVLLQQLQPIFAITAAAIFLKEKITRRFIVLAGVALAGSYLLSFPELRVNFDTGDATTMAAMLAIGSAAAWGASTALSKYALKDTYWLQVTGIRFALATIFSGIGLLIFSSANAVTSIGSSEIKLLLAIALSTGFVALGIYYYGLQRVRASRSTILELAWPLTAVLVGFTVDGAQMTFTQWVGAIVLTTAVIMIGKQEAENDTIKAKKTTSK